MTRRYPQTLLFLRHKSGKFRYPINQSKANPPESVINYKVWYIPDTSKYYPILGTPFESIGHEEYNVL